MKRHYNHCRRLSATLAVVAALFACAPTAHGDDWPVVRGNSLSSGVARSTIADQLEVCWTYHASADAGFEATAIVVGGVVYVGDNMGTFHAVRLADGKAVWSKSFDDTAFLAGAVYDREKLFAGDAGGVVRCLSAADGAEAWTAEMEGEIYAGPIVHENDVLVTCEAGTLSSFDVATGERRWDDFRIDAPLRCTPTLINGRALLAGCDSKLHFIDVATGAETDAIAIDAPTGATAAVRGERVYFGTEGGSFFAIDVVAADNPDNRPAVAWTYRDPERSQPIRSAAAVSDTLIVFGAQSKAIYGLAPADGKLKWKRATRSRVDSSPVIAGNRVVAATERGVLYVLDAANGDVKWQFDAGGGFTASPVVVDGHVLLGNADGTLYCFGAKDVPTAAKESDPQPPASSPQPPAPSPQSLAPSP